MKKTPDSQCVLKINCEQLKKYCAKNLVNTTPRRMIINGEHHPVEKWAEVARTFVRDLVNKGCLTDVNLPLVIAPRSRIPYINSTASSERCHKISEGIYVHTKYNAFDHVKKICATLMELGIAGEYTIEIEYTR